MKTLLLTGSTGFIGQYFLKEYAQKYEIQTFSFLNDDLESLECTDIDVVFHLSALVHQMGGATREAYEQINVNKTIELACKAKDTGVKQFVFMSTVKVYGEENTEVYTETSQCQPQDEYGKSKLKAEEELKKLETKEFKVSIIRTPIVYGYGVKANIKNLVSLVKKVPILPFGNIKNNRSMVYIGNLCHLADSIIEQEKSEVFLASDDESLSTTKLIELIGNALEKKVILIQIPLFELFLKLLKPSFHQRLYKSLEVDNSMTKKSLNLQNPFSIEDGIKLMIEGEK